MGRKIFSAMLSALLPAGVALIAKHFFLEIPEEETSHPGVGSGQNAAYAFSGNIFVNAEILLRGLAEFDRSAGDFDYRKLFSACELLAKKKQAGM